jgi:hypothetical protein
MSIQDRCAHCGHNRESHMPFNSRTECDFPDCNCHEIKTENTPTYDDLFDALRLSLKGYEIRP